MKRSITIVTGLWLGLVCVAFPAFGQKDYIAIATAFAPELDAITRAVEKHPEGLITETVTHKGVVYHLGKIKQQPVVMFTTGISIANAAMTTQMAIHHFDIKQLIMMGIAGAVDAKLQPGDLSVPERWYYHDESIYAKPIKGQPGKFELPDIFASLKEQRKSDTSDNLPDYRYFSYLYPNDVRVIKQGWSLPKVMPYFTVSQDMLAVARETRKTMPPISLDSGDVVEVNIGGNGASGSVFLDNPDYRDWVWETFSANVVDMESTAVGHVCFVNDVDWLVIRSVSDLAGAQSGQNTARLFNAMAAGSAARFAVNLVAQLGKNQTH